MKSSKILISIFLLTVIAVNIAGCSVTVNAADLMSGITPKSVTGKSADTAFTSSMSDFSVELFKKTVTDKQNSLVSPLSVMLALSMTANGADGETLSQMETLLGGGITLNDLNEYLYDYVKRLPSEDKSKLNIANSIWFRDDENRLQVKVDFLQKNADYYGASAYKSAFDSETLKDINNWVKTNTDGMIDKILDKIDDAAVMYLINAVVFDAEWKTVYYKENIRKSDFTNISGNKQNVDFMYSNEYKYLDDGKATGFIKPKAIVNKADECITDTQILNEINNIMIKKWRMFSEAVKKVQGDVRRIGKLVYIIENSMDKAVDLYFRYGFSYYDCLMLASALENDCDIIYTEDMNDGQIIDGKLKIINPFNGE